MYACSGYCGLHSGAWCYPCVPFSLTHESLREHLIVQGLPKILETVALNMFMEGNLNVIRKPGGGVDVTAKANLKVSAQLPNWMRPLPGVQEVGDSILQGILQGVKFAANFKLEQDFLEWVKIRDNPHWWLPWWMSSGTNNVSDCRMFTRRAIQVHSNVNLEIRVAFDSH